MAPQLTTSSYVVLVLVERLQPATAYDLKGVAQSTVFHFWSLPHTVLYSETKRLAEAGYLEAEQEAEGRRRRRFSLTPAGREALEAWRADPTDALLELRDPGLLMLFAGGDPKPLARAQLARHTAQLHEYERLSAGMDDDPSTAGLRSACALGITIERAYVAFWDEVAETGAAAIPPDRT